MAKLALCETRGAHSRTYKRELGGKRYLHFGIAAGESRIYRCNNLGDMQTHKVPRGVAEHHKGYLPPRQILLVAKIFVSRKKHLKTGLFGCAQ